MMKRIIGILNIIIVFQVFGLQNIGAQISMSRAQGIFIYNFTRLIEWPLDYKDGDFVIGVYNSPDLFDEVAKFTNGKTVGNQKIVVHKFETKETIGKCHILFIPFDKTSEYPSIIGILGSSKTLIITEKKGAIEAGSIINFVIVEDRLKFELSEANASKIGLKINSSLVKMAIIK